MMLARSQMEVSMKLALFLASGIVTASSALAADGKELFLAQKCNLCHSVDSQGIAKTNAKMKAPDLSNAGGMVESADWVKSFLKKEVKKDGKAHTKEFKGSAEELDAVAQWIVSLKKT
jgi:mono/diheme cytochrome c family protein